MGQLINSLMTSRPSEDLPPLTQRQERRIATHAQTLHSVDSWDFATTLNSATTSVYRRRVLEDMDLAAGPQEPGRIDGVFEMEGEIMGDDDNQRGGQHARGVSWDEGPPVVFEVEPSEADPTPSPLDTDDLETAIEISQSPPSSSTSDSSPPSSFVDSTLKPPEPPSHIPGVATALAVPEPRLKTSSSHIITVSPVSSSSSASVRSSASSKQNMWSKIKSNVRRHGSRNHISVGEGGVRRPTV